jgi:hypothetical protein
MSRWIPVCFALLALQPAGSTGSLVAQAPSPASARSSSLPRFTLREIIAGRNDSLFRIPGSWMRAATLAAPESLAMSAYISAAARSGVTPLEGSTLATQRSQHVMGLFRRAELVAAARHTLESIRSTIPSDSTRARFDRIFLSRGSWITDLHDAALAWAQSRKATITWGAARRPLTAAGWVPDGDTADVSEVVPRALYGLTVLAAHDSAAFALAHADLFRADAAAGEPVTLLLKGYAFGQDWYAEAVEFFLRERWIPDGGSGRSIGDLVREDW